MTGCGQMRFSSFKNVTYKLFVYKSFNMYKQDLALNNLQELICSKIQPTLKSLLTHFVPRKRFSSPVPTHQGLILVYLLYTDTEYTEGKITTHLCIQEHLMYTMCILVVSKERVPKCVATDKNLPLFFH